MVRLVNPEANIQLKKKYKMTIRTVEESWSVIESWLREKGKADVNYSKVLDALNPPATDEQIKDLEQKLKAIELPKSYIQALKIHNGVAHQVPFIDSWSFLSTELVLHYWNIMCKFEIFDDDSDVEEDGVQQIWHSPKWIPIAHNGFEDHLCLDLCPATGGQVGQIIEVLHDDRDRTKFASGFQEYFSVFADDIIEGKYLADNSGLYFQDSNNAH
ncbi:hypothetical protein DASC09_053560 [Saccharomycopsis crataegensis]|uniref:Knr4/Smi1-like domain-containing protein n=1 Tax=Saccharomycopsis crataegensis TaxID=43959 RepID=A0AAV5QU40_9ASCO|nr:hypothetical protein DASC09_053560 [Saccharomycopsis crataegensis]